MDHSAFFKQNVYPSIYAGHIGKLIRLNQELFITNKWLEQFNHTTEEQKELNAKHASLQNEITALRQEIADFQEDVWKSCSIESEIYCEILTKLDDHDQTQQHLFAEINNLLQEHDKVLNQLPLLDFNQQKQGEHLEEYKEWAIEMENKLLNQTKINEIIKEQLTHHSAILNDLLELCSDKKGESVKDSPENVKEDMAEKDELENEKEHTDGKRSNFSRFFKTLPANYPIAFLIVKGKKIPVTNFIRYDAGSLKVYCINDKAEVIMDCGEIDGVIFRPNC